MNAPQLPPPRSLLTTAADDHRVGKVRIAGLTDFPTLVAEMGGNPARLLKRCGLDPQIFDDSEKTISFRVISQLFALAVEETHCPHFGLLLGQRRKLVAILGPIGFLVQNSPTVGDALRNLIRNLHLHGVGTTAKLLVQRTKANYTFAIELFGKLMTDQVLDGTMASNFRLMRMICGPEWQLSAAYFAHPPPADITPYRELFHAPVHFDQEITALSFPAYWLKRPVHNADPALCPMLQDYMTQIEQQHSGNFPGQIRRVVRTMLSTGKCTSDRLADLFSMHRRTLYRRLTANGTTFKGIVEEARNEIAARNLAETNMPISQLAALLGYRDTNSFIRAFRRWSGAAPTEWRAHHRP
jgi:AraC-like DNA-binding protein